MWAFSVFVSANTYRRHEFGDESGVAVATSTPAIPPPISAQPGENCGILTVPLYQKGEEYQDEALSGPHIECVAFMLL